MVDSDTICSTWGDNQEHMDCEVVVTADTARRCVLGSPGQVGPWPVVCPCECRACKRAWWRAGRPVVRDGAVVRAEESL